MYPLVKIPSFASNFFFEFTKAEAKEYFQWFLGMKDDRVLILETEVKQIYSEWTADYTKESLVVLYEWFAMRIKYRSITEKEKKDFENHISKTPLFVGIIPTPQLSFTDETVSICFDSAIYIAQILINHVPELKWFQKLNSTNYIDYAQPLIGYKETKSPINPRRVLESLARQILDKETDKITFEMLYKKWHKKFLK